MEEVNKTMWQEVLDQSYQTLTLLFNKGIFFTSVLFGTFLSAIGYPKEVFLFILILVLIDLITKQYSIVVSNFKSFSLRNYKQAWINKNLTSRQIKNGITIKIILYSPILYISNKLGVIPEILYGSVISNILYTMLVLTEISSIFENFIECGYTGLIPFLKFINNKKDKLVEDEDK